MARRKPPKGYHRMPGGHMMRDSEMEGAMPRNRRSPTGGKNPLAKSENAYGERGEKWIQGAIAKPGALHAQMGVAMGEPIPAERLRKAAKKKGKLGRRARLALTLSKIQKGRKLRKG